MRKIVCLVAMISQLAFGGFEQTELGARAKSLGGACCALSNDVWAIFNNVGGLANLNQHEVSVFYAPQQFGLAELSLSAVAAAFPAGIGVLGFAARRYGFDLYREVSWTMSYANTVSAVAIGINVNYHSLSIERYGSSGTVGIDVGGLVPVTRQLRWGISAKNVNSPTIGVSREPLPQSFTSGFAYFPLRELSISVDYFKEAGFDGSVRFGFEYGVVNAVALRIGVSNQPAQYAGGIGIQYGMFEVDYAFFTHQELGITHQGSILIRW